jgi:CO/xanthine dehydrogenase Mo-binding subunit
MEKFNIVGKAVPRNDADAKARGSAIYTDDMKLPGMLHGRILRSPLAHARILRIDTGKAASLPGVKCVITAEDTPKIKYGNWRLFPDTQDEYPLALDKVRFIGDEVAAVAAVDKDTAEEALRLIQVPFDRGLRSSMTTAKTTSASTGRSSTEMWRRGFPSRTTYGRTPSKSMR